ncbi:MAG: DNA-binding response regulator [Nitrospira sp.]|nr:MAG: DNA-binding response regulator [Nitrospira sp.]
MERQSFFRIVLIDDSRMVRLGIREQLLAATDFRIVGEAMSAVEGIEVVEQVIPDLVLLDSRLPDLSGVEACRKLIARDPARRVLMLSIQDDPAVVQEAVAAGARGYLLKDAPVGTWLAAMRRVASGDVSIQPHLFGVVLKEVHEMGNGLSSKSLASLSPQEYRLLPLVAEGKTNKEIASALDLSAKTVKNYLANIFSKLGITRRTQAATLYARALPSRSMSSGHYV